MKIIKMLAAFMALPLCFIAACSENPLDSLKQDQPSAVYNESYWHKQQVQNTDLWKKAIVLCDQELYRATPNCGAIHDIELFADPLPMPKYGSGVGFGADSIPVLPSHSN